MKPMLPLLGAGAGFAATTLAGMAAGVWIARSTGHPLWVIGGLMAGMALGGYAAVRLLVRSL